MNDYPVVIVCVLSIVGRLVGGVVGGEKGVVWWS